MLSDSTLNRKAVEDSYDISYSEDTSKSWGMETIWMLLMFGILIFFIISIRNMRNSAAVVVVFSILANQRNFLMEHNKHLLSKMLPVWRS